MIDSTTATIAMFDSGLGGLSILREVRAVARRLDTVVAIGVSTRCDSESNNPLEELLRREGFDFVRGKTNLGMGRASNPNVVRQPELAGVH